VALRHPFPTRGVLRRPRFARATWRSAPGSWPSSTECSDWAARWTWRSCPPASAAVSTSPGHLP